MLWCVCVSEFFMIEVQMAKKYFSVFSAVVCMLLTMLCGCMSVDCVMTETFPPVDEVRKYDKAVEIPYEYSVIGVCQTEGNYTEFSYDDMMKRIVERAGENGADGVLLLGMRVVPDGRVVQISPLRTSLDATYDGGQWDEISKDFGGGYGSIRNKNFGTAQTYDRIIRVQLLRFKRDAKGEFIPRKKNSGADNTVVPLKSIDKLKKESKDAKAN